MHIHGYRPQVVKVGYPNYNADGTINSSNTDMTCRNGPCQQREAVNAFWASHVSLPLQLRKDAPYKDNIVVPIGGYVVLRFVTDNPGSWALEWRHNERHGVSNHQRLGCLLKRLFWRRSKKTPKPRVTGLGEGNPPVTGGFPSQRATYLWRGKCFHLMASSWEYPCQRLQYSP